MISKLIMEFKESPNNKQTILMMDAIGTSIINILAKVAITLILTSNFQLFSC